MSVGPTRQDTFEVNLRVAGADFGVWDAREGGELDSEENKYPPGGMQPKISLGGARTTGNLTMSRLYRLQRDHDKIQFLFNNVGRGEAIASQQPLDLNGHSYGRPIVWRGVLKRVTPPPHDSKSNDEARIEIEISPEGEPTS